MSFPLFHFSPPKESKLQPLPAPKAVEIPIPGIITSTGVVGLAALASTPPLAKSVTTPERTLWNQLPPASPIIEPRRSIDQIKPKVQPVKTVVIDEEFEMLLRESALAEQPLTPTRSALSMMFAKDTAPKN